jgi:hypothetical protein
MKRLVSVSLVVVLLASATASADHLGILQHTPEQDAAVAYLVEQANRAARCTPDGCPGGALAQDGLPLPWTADRYLVFHLSNVLKDYAKQHMLAIQEQLRKDSEACVARGKTPSAPPPYTAVVCQ